MPSTTYTPNHIPPDEANERKRLESQVGQTWTTQELQEEFTVHSFMAPLVIVTRKADGAKGSMEFMHSPRYYFRFKVDN